MAPVYDPETDEETKRWMPGPGHDKPAGKSSDPRSENAAAGDSSDPRSELSRAEQGGAGGGSFNYNPSDKLKTLEKLSSPVGVALAAKNFFWGSRRRKAGTTGGAFGVGGLIATLMMLSVISGPLQFLNIGSDMQSFHFAKNALEEDKRFFQMINDARKYIKNKNSGGEQTTEGELGGEYSQTFLDDLQAEGVTANFDGNGNFKSLTLDPAKNPKLEDVANQNSLNPNSDGTYTVSAEDLVKSGTMTEGVLTATGEDGLAQEIGYRFEVAPEGLDLHVMNNEGENYNSETPQEQAQTDQQENQEQSSTIEDGVSAPTISTQEKDSKGNPCTDQKASATDCSQASNSENDTTQAQSQSQQTASAEAGGGTDSPRVKSFRDNIKDVLSGKSLSIGAGIGFLCSLVELSAHWSSIKMNMVILPLIRTTTLFMSVASQIKSHQGVSLSRLSNMSKQLYDANKITKNSSDPYAQTGWKDSETQIAEEQNSGMTDVTQKKDAGIKPGPTLTGVGAQENPLLGFLGDVPLIGTACALASSTIGGAVITVVSFFGGGVENITTNMIAKGARDFAIGLFGGIAINKGISYLTDFLTHWLLGSPATAFPKGAQLGNYLNFGGRLAANSQAITAGGSALSDTEVAQLDKQTTKQQQQRFTSNSFADRIFNPYLPGSLVNKMATDLSPSISTNFADIFTHASSIFSDLVSAPASLLSHPALADSGSANLQNIYGFSEYGFSDAEMNSARDPYPNSVEAAELLDQDCVSNNAVNTSCGPITEAFQCFGVNITGTPESGSQGQYIQWDVQVNTDPSKIPNPYNTSGSNAYPSNCNSDSQFSTTVGDPVTANWQTIRFYIMDTEVMKSMACYEGDATSCSELGFQASSAPATPTHNAPYFTTQGNKILVTQTNKQFVPYGISIIDDLDQSDWCTAHNEAATDAQIKAAGQYWHANTIRIQVSEDKFENGATCQGVPSEGTTQALQRLITEVNEIESLGAIPVISDNTERTNPSQHGPTNTTLNFWQVVTAYLSGNGGGKYSNVVFDIYNEPATDGSVWQKGGSYCTTSSGTATDGSEQGDKSHKKCATYLGMQTIVNSIRSASNSLSNNLILVEGPRAASTLAELDQYPITGSDLVFAYHHVDFTNPVATWENDIGLNLKTKVPIIDGEWTEYASTRTYECYPRAPQYVANYLNVLKQNDIGLIFWSLEPGVGIQTNNPQPVSDSLNTSFPTDVSAYSQPTSFGSNYACTTQNGQPDGNLLQQGAGSDIMQYFAKNDPGE